ncbi:PGF-pre-PGF domain-containing protein [Methanocorpusculum sp.]|nr:PGF-pre-PGF domain-containing protein [Methanocorpusculum sp.]
MTMKTKKTLQHIAAVAVVLLTLCLVFAAPAAAEAVYSGGDGIEDAPYQISTVSDLKNLSTAVNADGTTYAGKYFQLAANLDLEDEKWTPIGGNCTFGVTPSKLFCGSFDGQNYHISNLMVEEENSAVGLFGAVGPGAVIKNVYLENVQVTGLESVGALIGHSNTAGTASVSNCHVSGTIIVGGVTQVGGLIGSCGIGTVSGCSVNADNAESIVAGIYIEEDKEGDNIGGLIGQAYTNAPTGSPVALSGSSADINVFGFRKVGGLVGMYLGGSLSGSHATGDVFLAFNETYGSGKTLSVGSLIGEMKGAAGVSEISNSYASGSVGMGLLHAEDGTTVLSSAEPADGATISAGLIGAVRDGPATGTYDAWWYNVDLDDIESIAPYMKTKALGQISTTADEKGKVNLITSEEDFRSLEDDKTYTLACDLDLTGYADISHSVIIDGNGKTITAGDTNTYQKLLRLWGAASSIDVTLKNINVNGGSHYAVLVGTEANLVIESATLTGWNAVYVVQESTTWPEAKGDGSTVTIKNSVLSGTNSGSEGFGTVAIFANSTAVTISGSTLTAEVTGSGIQSIIRYGGMNDPVHGDSAVTITDSTLNVLNSGTGTASIYSNGTAETGTLKLTLGEGVTANVNPSAYIAGGMEVVQPGDKYLVQKYVDRSSSSSSSSTTEPEEPEQPEEPVVEPETPAAPGEVASSTEVTDGGEVAFETTVVDDETGEQSAPAAADSEIKGVVLPTGTEGTVEFVPVSEQPAPAGQEENTKRVFEINVPSYKKGEAAVIKFQMTVAELAADGKEAADVALWHYDEETGEWTKLVTSFIIKDGIVYFEAITNDFSPFAIVYADEPAADLPTDTPETPEQPEEPASPAPVLAVLVALGAAVVLRRK